MWRFHAQRQTETSRYKSNNLISTFDLNTSVKWQEKRKGEMKKDNALHTPFLIICSLIKSRAYIFFCAHLSKREAKKGL